MKAKHVYEQQNGDVTKAYYAILNAKGLNGELAVALFRAHKRSTAAKKYKGRKFTRSAYDVKNWSLGEVCRILAKMDDGTENPAAHWGWKHDPNTPGYTWVLYVELPCGQVSFHSPDRLEGPDYPGVWDGIRNSAERIQTFCDNVMQITEEMLVGA